MEWEEKHKRAKDLQTKLYGGKRITSEQLQRLADDYTRERYFFLVSLVEVADWIDTKPEDLMAQLDMQDFDLPVANAAKTDILNSSMRKLRGYGHGDKLPVIIAGIPHGEKLIPLIIEAAKNLNRLASREITDAIIEALQK